MGPRVAISLPPEVRGHRQSWVNEMLTSLLALVSPAQLCPLGTPGPQGISPGLCALEQPRQCEDLFRKLTIVVQRILSYVGLHLSYSLFGVKTLFYEMGIITGVCFMLMPVLGKIKRR